MTHRAKHPTVVLGLDGGTFNIIKPLVEKGLLPNLSSLLQEGWHGDLLSTIPTATLPAWTSFLTSALPSEHGVVDLFVRTKGSYSLTPGSGVLRQLPTFAWRLSQQGYRVCTIGVPGTYPPEPLNGICVAGFDSPSPNRAGPEAVSPPEAFSTLQAAGGWGYNVFNEHQASTNFLRGAVDCILSDLAEKEKTILNLFTKEPWDLFMVHLQASDTVAHHFWHWHDLGSPRRPDTVPMDAISLVYQRLDVLVGKLKKRLASSGRIMVVSDHGFGGASTLAVYINRWLHQNGYLRFFPSWKTGIRNHTGTVLRSTLKRLPNKMAGWAQKSLPGPLRSSLMGLARGANVDFAQSIAFSDEFDYAPSIWLNNSSFFPSGRVTNERAPKIRERLRRDLLELCDPRSGQRIFSNAHLRDDLGSGPGAQHLPDIILEPSWPNGYRPSFLASNGPGVITRQLTSQEFNAPKGFGMPGVHEREGVFIAWGEGIEPQSLPALDIHEAGSLVFPFMGAKIPANLPTPPPPYLEELLPYEHAAPQISHAPSGSIDSGSNPALTERLRSFGYLD